MRTFDPVPLTDDLARRVVETRRDLHRFPELGLTEFRTASLIASRLESRSAPDAR
jgi:metal-dependent amidase/aminoacylase/carboxypeptidase family protein